MALSLAKAAPLKPEIKLAQALSEFEAVLPDDQKSKFRTYRGQSPPSSTDVMRFTAEIDRDAGRNRKSRKCVGTRLTNVLHGIQQFSTVVDFIVGSSQSQIAAAIWGSVKISLQLASAISSYFDQLSTLFMRIGVTCPRYQDFGLLYPESTRLQGALCQYFVVIVHLCKHAVLFLKRPFWSQLSSSILNPFESEFGTFQQDLESLARAIQEEVLLASNQSQQNEAKEMSRFRALTKKYSDTSTQEAMTQRKKMADLRFLNACSVYNHENTWKQARKQGNTDWIYDDKGYKQWKEEKLSSTLWCTGILGSGKTVLSASVVEDLKITTTAVVSYFFCRHDEAKSLETRTIIGSIARQIFEHVRLDLVDEIAEMKPSAIDTDQILSYLQELLPSDSHKYFIVIDGLDECSKKETILLLQCLKQLLMSKHAFQVYCSSRPDVSLWAHKILEPKLKVSMSQTSVDIEEYIEDSLAQHFESGSLSVGSSPIIFKIQDVLLKKAQGMFLWVVFQIDSICSQETDETILAALEDLPKDLPETFNRILRRLHHSHAADSRFSRIIFDLVAAAQRPLSLEELREAVSVRPGEKSWDPSKVVNNMLRLLLDSCGSLVTIDEEHQTVRFTHHSVKQHLLSKPMDSDLRHYHIDMKAADLYLGEIIVTYLNFEVFNAQLTKAEGLSQAKIDPSAILTWSLPQSKLAKRLAVRLSKSKGNSGLDIHSQLKTAAGIVGGFNEHIQPVHPFLCYAQEYWLFHTKECEPARLAENDLWQSLIDGADIDSVNGNDGTALQAASVVGHESIVKLLLKNGANVNAKGRKDGNALHAASGGGYAEVVRILLHNGADVNANPDHNSTALQAASAAGHETVARMLLTNGANVNAEGGFYGTALQAASAAGHETVARMLLTNGANVNAEGGDYGTALQAASAAGHELMVKLLLEMGANVNAEGRSGGTVFQSASAGGTALQAASAVGHESMLKLLLEMGANVNAEGRSGGTALQAASGVGRESIVKLLLKNGANVNAKDGKDRNALHAASGGGYAEVVRILLHNGADVNARTGYLETALHAASWGGYAEVVRILLHNGADVNARTGYHETALQAASWRGYAEVARLLLHNGADRYQC